MEISRFGPGFRRRVAPAGTRGIADQAIWADPRGRVTELAFARKAVMAPQTSLDMGLFIVISGGGWVQVGDERAPVNHGEAVEWPPGISHGAWTDGSEMRAILLELPDEAVEAGHLRLSEAEANAASAADGSLAERHVALEDHDETEGEPW